MKNYAVIPPEFWAPSQRHALLPATIKLLLIYLTALSDKDGIASIPDGFTKLINSDCQPMTEKQESFCLDKLVKIGSIAVYHIAGTRWAWLPDRAQQQPVRGNYAASRRTSLPAPPADTVRDLLRVRLHRDPTDKEVKAASPRTFKSSRASSGVVQSDVVAVFEEWRGRQVAPNRCICSPSVQAMIKAALQQASSTDLKDLIRFAYESDHAAARFWQGHNQHKRKYLGLDNLLRASKLQDRLQLVAEWQQEKPIDGQPSSQLGYLAKYRSGTQTRQTPEPERADSQRGKILALLKMRGPMGVMTSELAEIGLRYGARISELRGKGHRIEVKGKAEDGNNRYVLIRGV